MRDDRTVLALALVVALVAVANIARSLWVPGAWHLWFNLGFGVAVVAVGVGVGTLSADELGVGRATWLAGVRLGTVAFAVIAGGLVLAGLVSALRGLLADDRTTVSTGRMLLRVLVLIPVGTVLVEELVFRGVLHGLARRLAAPVPAAIGVAVLFGLWHLLPVWRSSGGDGLADGGAAGGKAAAVAGTFVATFVAGLGFAWLRERSGSVLAPMAAHLATNSVAFAVAWTVAR